VASGQPGLQSVDSQCRSRVIEPRKAALGRVLAKHERLSGIAKRRKRSAASSYQTVGGKHDGDIGLRDRVYATTTDSTVGETDAGEGTDLLFDTLDHAHLRAFLQQRIRDGVVLRLIGKWLNAGVMEAGAVTHPEAGSPQGGVVSPVLANVYLHYVLDQWFTRAVKTMAQWCRSHRHDPIAEQHTVLCQKLRGHAAYYGITGNSPALARYRYEVLRVWRKWLPRRRRAWRAPWDWFRQLLARYPLPNLRAIHSVYRGVANG